MRTMSLQTSIYETLSDSLQRYSFGCANQLLQQLLGGWSQMIMEVNMLDGGPGPLWLHLVCG